jgi:hypothetical protein
MESGSGNVSPPPGAGTGDVRDKKYIKKQDKNIKEK